jgi:nicotinamide-nucleotide amidase
MIGEMITDVPGSSAFYLGGVVSYANSAKSGILGVDPSLIERHGAVSREVAEAMATGARAALGADVAIAVTGIAGPDGGSDGKPVGTVWIAVASTRGVRAERYQLGRERAYVRARAASTALDMARREAMEGGDGGRRDER